MPLDNFPSARRIIEHTEGVFDLPVRLTHDETMPVGAVVHLSEIASAQRIRISLNPDRADIDYLVATQCGAALRYKRFSDGHLSPATNAESTVIKQMEDLGIDPAVASAQGPQILAQLGGQLRGAPGLLSVASWLHREYPELHSSQRLYFEREAGEGAQALRIQAGTFPDWLLHTHQAINGTQALAADFLYDIPVYRESYKDTELEPLTAELFHEAFNGVDHKSDRQLVEQWQQILSIGQYFRWTGADEA